MSDQAIRPATSDVHARSGSCPTSPRPATSPRPSTQLAEGIERGDRFQTLLGITGSGKSATIAWTIEQVQRPTLVIAPNKSLAAQLANEFREFFPDNRVEYFVCYYDYYQPEAYMPVERHLHREGQLDQRRDRPAAPLGHRRPCSPGATPSWWPRCRASTAWARPRSTATSCSSCTSGDELRPALDPAPARRHAVRAQRHEPGAGQVPGAGRHHRGPPGLRRDGACASSCSATSRAHHRRRPAHRRAARPSSTSSSSSRPPTTSPATSACAWPSVGIEAELQERLACVRGARASCSRPSACACAPSTTSR